MKNIIRRELENIKSTKQFLELKNRIPETQFYWISVVAMKMCSAELLPQGGKCAPLQRSCCSWPCICRPSGPAACSCHGHARYRTCLVSDGAQRSFWCQLFLWTWDSLTGIFGSRTLVSLAKSLLDSFFLSPVTVRQGRAKALLPSQASSPWSFKGVFLQWTSSTSNPLASDSWKT